MPRPQNIPKKWLFLLGLVVILVSFIAFTRPGKTLYKVFRLATALNPSETTFTKPSKIKYAQISYPDDGKFTQALIFRKGAQKQSAVIISAGVGLTNYNTSLINSFASSLADLGITVMIPQTQSMQDNIVTESSIRSYVNAFRYLESQNSIDKNKIGYFGFCAGASFLALAAEDKDIADRISLLALFSPYNDLIDYYAQAFAHQAITVTNSRDWKPHPQTVDLLEKNFTYRANLIPSETLNAAQTNQITKQPQNALEKKRQIESVLPQTMLDEAKLLSPNHAAQNIKAKTYIVHDYNDTFTPREESERLKAEIQNAQLIEPTIFDHTIFRKDISPLTWAIQGSQVLIFFYKILYNVS